MASASEILNTTRQKFAAHRGSGRQDRFILDSQDRDLLSRFSRQLESRRQTGELSASETQVLKEVDALLADIAEFNSEAKAGGASSNTPGLEKIYDPQKGELTQAIEALPAFVPKISQAEADQIITDLNEQFVDKVLKKLRARAEVSAAKPWEVADFVMPAAPQSPGESLSDYLSRVRSELPDQPFGDPDSAKDLSLLKQGHGVRQKN